MTNLKRTKTTFELVGSSDKKIKEIQSHIKAENNKHVTRTDIINIAVCEFLKNIKRPEDVIRYLQEYNKV